MTTPAEQQSNVDALTEVGSDTVTHVVRGAEVVCLEAGAGGRPLFLVHGFTGCKEDFADEMAPLAALGYHVISPDLRGHGDSHAPEEEIAYSLAEFASELFALADVVGWERFDLLGHSMGGMIAQHMVLAEPQRIARLVLMDTHHGVVDDLDPVLIELGIELARTEGLKVIQDILKSGADPLSNPAYTRLCAERPGYQEFAEGKMLRCSPAMYAAMLRELSSLEDRLDRLSAVSVPTLVLVGELDAPFRRPSERLVETIADATLVVHPEGGHSPQFEATDHWREALHNFLGPAESLRPGDS